ncbi:pleckstrin homology domain-containing family G member 7 [Emydura macquarii macquarii]|uniref:pleckstrin homology domain-containing family G member 7 n=1 Tax=Emydura macquarii macquarii TaxID=1129001 RepID=UPI00352AAE9B
MSQSHKPWEYIQVDLQGPLPEENLYLLVMYNTFSKDVVAQPLKAKSTEAVTVALMKHVVLQFSPPNYICSDQGKEFESWLVDKVCRQLQLSKMRTSVAHPVFVNMLKYLQNNEFLLDVDLWGLFANLEELNQMSLSFVTNFFKIVKDHVTASEFSLDFISVLTKYFQGNLCQTHQIYCLHYTSAVFYLENLRQREDFGIYLKLKCCEQNEQCRLRLSELLVAPLHRLTRNPLLLNNIWKRSTDAARKVTICSNKEKVEKAIQSTRILDVYLFLFNDFLLISKTKRNKKKYGGSDIGSISVCPSFTPELQSLVKDGVSCRMGLSSTVLERLTLKNVTGLFGPGIEADDIGPGTEADVTRSYHQRQEGRRNTVSV